MWLLNVWRRYSSLLLSGLETVKCERAKQDWMSQKLDTPIPTHSWWNRITFVKDWIVPFVAKTHTSICSTDDAADYSYTLSVRIYALFCLKAFCLDVSLNSNYLFAASSLGLGSRFRIKNLVPTDSPIVTACRKGDTTAVWMLFHQGKASVNDTTADNRSPLRVIYMFWKHPSQGYLFANVTSMPLKVGRSTWSHSCSIMGLMSARLAVLLNRKS